MLALPKGSFVRWRAVQQDPRTLPGEWNRFIWLLSLDASGLTLRSDADPERVLAVLVRIVQTYGGNPVDPEFVRSVIERFGTKHLGPSLADAIAVLGPDRALQLFEDENLRLLKWREDLVKH